MLRYGDRTPVSYLYKDPLPPAARVSANGGPESALEIEDMGQGHLSGCPAKLGRQFILDRGYTLRALPICKIHRENAGSIFGELRR